MYKRQGSQQKRKQIDNIYNPQNDCKPLNFKLCNRKEIFFNANTPI